MDVKIGDVVELMAGGRSMTVDHCEIVEGADTAEVACSALATAPEADQQALVCTIWLSYQGTVQSHCFAAETVRPASTDPPRPEKLGY